ncbi:flagellar basal-body MS-ring/collar protein FliF [Acidicapsa ligni]|uniref:flagellar basal-body MS-ring/collar protein FliF n=1 Tax=Acidicapsa ligni TaxID=542300 RepID=UPI0021E09D16|nr:flagellar basal-body MS-ring/collar protein FliF [Acidicapsa ligni]
MATGTQLNKAASAPAESTGRPSDVPGAQPLGSQAGMPALERMTGWWEQGAGHLAGHWVAHWSTLPRRQRSWMLVTAGLVLASVSGLIWYATRTDWRTLYAGLDPEDSRQMAQVLTQAQIPFDLAANGTTLLVPVGQLDKARLATAAKGGPRSGRLGFELFDKPNWVGSEFDEQVNYQRALEGELEHTVATLSDIQSARVHLVMPHDSLFRDQERPAKASVVLTLRHRSLADGEDEAIRNLVASAVDGLSPAQVSLVDASGHLPLGPKSSEAMRLGMEQALEAKLVETLEPVTGPGNVRASVTVDYDPTAIEETDETYDPAQTVTLSMQRTEQTTGAQPIAAGVPGTASNAPNSQTLPVYPQQVSPPQNAKTESGTYGTSRKVKHTTEAPGHIRRLTAAIVVNDRLATLAQKGKTASWQPRTPEELRTLTSLAQAAVGFDSNRGDLVSVQDLAFDENRNAAATSPIRQVLEMAEDSPVLIKYGTVLVGILMLILLGIRPALRRSRTDPALMAKNAGELAGNSVQAALPPAESAVQDAERQRVQQVFDQVTNTLKRDPTQSSRLLQSWIHSD